MHLGRNVVLSVVVVVLLAGCPRAWGQAVVAAAKQPAPAAKAADAPPPLLAGAAEVEITPPVGYRMSGYFYERPSSGVHDPLKAKALAFRQGENRAAVVCCDLIGVPWILTERARKAAAEKTGVPPENIMICATHTHTGPLFHGMLREHFNQQAAAKEPVDYAAFLVEKIAEAVHAAQRAERPVTIESGVARQKGLAFNRRFHMKDGTVRFNPGKLNADIVKAAGPIDPDVGMVLLRDASDRRPLAGLTVFALHLDTVGGTDYGADYPLYLAESLREALGGPFVSLFGTGTCGDINHVDVSHNRPQKGHDEAKRIGQTLAETLKQQLPKLRASVRPSLAVRMQMVEAPLQQPTPEDRAWAKENMNKVGKRQLPFLEEVKLCTIIDLERRGASIRLPVQVVRLSDEVAVVGLPGEVFVDLGLAIKRASPFATTLVIELANDCPAYIPTKKAFAEGSYETVNSRIAPGGGELLVEAAVRALKQLR